MPDQEGFRDLSFPLKGLNISTEFELQPPGTTPEGVNVRAYEPAELRGRGGSRPGLIRYIPEQLATGLEIQHLAVIVTQHGDYTTTHYEQGGAGSFIWAGPGGEDDPSSNNRFWGIPDTGDGPGPGGWDGSGMGDSGPGGGGAGDGHGDPLSPLTRNPGRRIRAGGSGVMPVRSRPGRTTGSGFEGEPDPDVDCTTRRRDFTFDEFEYPDPEERFGLFIEWCSCDDPGHLYDYFFDNGTISVVLTELTVAALNARFQIANPGAADPYVSASDSDLGTPCEGS